MEIQTNKPFSSVSAVVFIAMLGFLAFGSTLKVGFLWDDHVMIESNPVVKSMSLSSLKHIFTNDVFEGHGDAYYRPLQSLSYMLEYQVWGVRPFGYHLTNLCLHLFNACLLFFLLSRLSLNYEISFFTSCLFVVHPINVEQMLIIAGRGELLATTFILMGLVALSQPGRPSKWLSVVCYGASMLSKETGLIFPGLVALLVVLDPSTKRNWRYYALLGLMAVSYLALRTTVVPVSQEMIGLRHWPSFLVRELPSILIEYVRILCFPIDLHSHRRMIFSSVTQILSLILVVGILVALVRKKNRFVWFGVGWFIFPLMPKFPILATNSLMLDHWAYMSAIGVSFFLMSVLFQFSLVRVPSRLFLFVAILVFWLSCSIFYSRVRSTDEKMYLWALRYPTSSIVRANLGLLYYQRGDFQNARSMLENSLRMNSNSSTANVLALTEASMGLREQAIKRLREWIAIDSHDLQSKDNLALITGGTEGLNQINLVLDEHPNRIDALFIKARLQRELKDNSGADQTLRAILALDPTNSEARRALDNSAHLLQVSHG